MGGKFRVDGFRRVDRASPSGRSADSTARKIKDLLTIGVGPRRKLQRELRPAVRRIRDGDGSVQGVHDATDNRQSQACAFLACFPSPKSFKDLLTKLGRYAWTRIMNLD